MRDQTARNLVALLQAEPLAYRHFGYYWWWIKLELKRAGFDRDQLSALGDLTDKTCEEWYKTRRPSELLQEAIEHQQTAAFVSYLNNTHAVPLTAGGGVYVVYDSDVE